MALMWLRSRLHSEARPPPAARAASDAALTRKHSVRRSSVMSTTQPCGGERLSVAEKDGHGIVAKAITPLPAAL